MAKRKVEIEESDLCVYCEEAKAEHEDPSEPIMEYGKCVCTDCFEGLADSRIEDLMQEVNAIERDLLKINPKQYKITTRA